MTDKILEDIKSGRGLSPLPNDSGSSIQPGVRKEQSEKGITYEKFNYNGDKQNVDSKEND